ncbi:E3 ubiquitin-protein ligase RNF185 [Drosophila gunungcola]|uniref:RING-type E3 ubiquitin transferase n=1 Tax=Drosophila gunungcola TaxID=103775 RepID=A0A9P9YJ27_9MUSC|nr:E3 ubiquitin-protein ligase RNF185 [Drosophila gunungcola]KAI8037871.1 hypothetical protein M5D96_009372 [Drosophila gunungcola]
MGEESFSKELCEQGPLMSETTGPKTNDEVREQGDASSFDCNICLGAVQDPVVTMCGHLFCWPCLHQWLLTQPNRKLCPVCKSAVDRDRVVPLYGRNNPRQADPRNKIPPRPTGHRSEPEVAAAHAYRFGGRFHMSVGLGFPFGFITSSLNFGEPRPAARNRGTQQFQDEQNLSKLFLFVAFVFICWLVFV